MLRVVQIIPDDRDMFRCYDRPEPFFGPAPTELLEGLASLASEVEVHVMACARRSLQAPEKLAENIFYHQVLIPGGYRRTLFIKAIREVRKLIRQIRPDVVHGQGTEDYPGLCAAFSGHPNCIALHGNMRAVARKLKYRPFPSMAITALAEWVALRKTDAVICNSAYTERCVGKLNKNKVRIPNAVRSSFFDVRVHRLMNDGCQVHGGAANDRGNDSSLLSVVKDSQSTQQPSNSSTKPAMPVLLCVGEVVPYKNQIGLIHALDALASTGIFKLSFIGRCNAKSAYGSRFLEEVSGREWCEHVEPMGEESLKKMLLSCCGLIHPTLEDSFGLVVAEAQVLGVPVAASNIGGLPDLIKPGNTGFLFNPQDPADIRDKVVQLLKGSVSENLQGNAHIFAGANYRPQVVALKHLDFYKTFLRRK